MMDQKMVEGILWNDYYKVAWVNIVTGDYDFVKILETEEEKPCLEARTIYEYSELIVSTGLVPDDDVEQYQRCTNRSFIMKEVMEKRSRVTVNFRRIIGSAVRWVRLEVVIPDDFSEAHPWVVYTWKESDAGICSVEDAMQMLSQCFHKYSELILPATASALSRRTRRRCCRKTATRTVSASGTVTIFQWATFSSRT